MRQWGTLACMERCTSVLYKNACFFSTSHLKCLHHQFLTITKHKPQKQSGPVSRAMDTPVIEKARQTIWSDRAVTKVIT